MVRPLHVIGVSAHMKRFPFSYPKKSRVARHRRVAWFRNIYRTRHPCLIPVREEVCALALSRPVFWNLNSGAKGL
jgi:hypothetical protein